MKSIEKKIKIVKERLDRLKKLAQKLDSIQDYITSIEKKDITERNLQIGIEACLDIGKIIISNEGLDEPKDNKGIFLTLYEASLISTESLNFLIPMAGTRNILVHGYDKVDDNLLYGILKKHLDDFDLFLGEIYENYLLKHKKAEKK